jgi:hypothetical protein
MPIYKEKTFNKFFEPVGEYFEEALKYTIETSNIDKFNEVYDTIKLYKMYCDITDCLKLAAETNDKFVLAKLIDLLKTNSVCEMDVEEILKSSYTTQIKEMLETAINMYPKIFYTVSNVEYANHEETDEDV